MQIKPILAALRGHRLATVLIAMEIALSMFQILADRRALHGATHAAASGVHMSSPESQVKSGS